MNILFPKKEGEKMKTCEVCGNHFEDENKGEVYFGKWTCGGCINKEEIADEMQNGGEE